MASNLGLGNRFAGYPYQGQPCGFQQISAATLASATALTVPGAATYCVIEVDTANVRWRDDGTSPTAAVGVQMYAGAPAIVFPGNMNTVKFILVSGSPVLNVSYYY